MIFAFDDFELNGDRLELRRAGKVLQADALVLRLLVYLVRNAGKLVSKEELVETVWGGRQVADNAVTVSMARLRKLLGQSRNSPEFVTTTYGRGYRFVREVVVRDGINLPPAAHGGGHDTGPPFVGRERVLLQLRRAFAEARAGRGRGCLLLGEPGIGKTRAVEAFVREVAGPEVRIAWGFCREAGDTPPLWPWVRLLTDLLAADSGTAALADALPEDLRKFLGLAQGPAMAFEPVLSAVETLTSPERHRHFDAILRRFVDASEATPCVLVIDDLHRADAASLELLVQLLDEIAHTRILLIAALRHLPGWRSPRVGTYLPNVLGHRNCARIPLERLDRADVHRYVAALLDDPNAAFGRAVYAKSEGNPFFMTEFARSLIDAPKADPRSLAVPAAALELVRQRVSRFDGEVRAVLSAAAVIGRSFELPILAAVTEREPSKLMVVLDEAIEAEIIVAAPGSMTAFAFGHALLRDVLYDALPALEQRSWHLRVATVLDARHDAGEAIPPSELAYHFHAALPNGDIRRAIQSCRAAAAAAAAVFASPDVVRYARHALEALELMERPSMRLRMSLYYLISMFARSHAPEECARAIRKVARLAQESGDVVMLLRAATMYNVQPGFEPMPGQTELLEQVLDLLRPEQIGFRSVAFATLALAAPYCNSAARSGELIERAVPLCRESGSPLAHYAVMVCKLYRFGGPAHAAIAAETAEELERQVVQNPTQTPALPVTLATTRAITAFQLGDLAALTAATERACMRSHAIGSGQSLWCAERMLALTRIQFGVDGSGVSELERLHQKAEHGTIWGAPLLVAFDRAVTLPELGHTPRPLDLELRTALQYRPSDPPIVWSLKLRANAACGRVDEARAALHAIPAHELAELPCDRDYLGTLGHLARAAIALHEREYAEAVSALLAPYPDHFSVGVTLVCEGAITHVRGFLAAELGRPAEAAVHFEAAIRSHERAGLALLAIESRLQLARCLQSAGDADRRARTLALEAYAGAVRHRHDAKIAEATALLSVGEAHPDQSLPDHNSNMTQAVAKGRNQH